MKLKASSVVAGIFLIAPTALTQQYPYSCALEKPGDTWGKIQFTSTNGIGGYQGALYMDGKWIISFREGSFQGYGSNWWSLTAEGQDKISGGGSIILFKNGVPFRSSSEGYQSGVETKLLTVGLGSTLYYGNQRGNYALIRAAEGFWIPQKGCRHINGRY